MPVPADTYFTSAGFGSSTHCTKTAKVEAMRIHVSVSNMPAGLLIDKSSKEQVFALR